MRSCGLLLSRKGPTFAAALFALVVLLCNPKRIIRRINGGRADGSHHGGAFFPPLESSLRLRAPGGALRLRSLWSSSSRLPRFSGRIPVSAKEGMDELQNYIRATREKKREGQPPDILITGRVEDGQMPSALNEESEGCLPLDWVAEDIDINETGQPEEEFEFGAEYDEAEKTELQAALEELKGMVKQDGLDQGNPPAVGKGGYGWRHRQARRQDDMELDMSMEEEDLVGLDRESDEERPYVHDSARDYKEEVLSGEKFWGDTTPDDFRSGFISIIGNPNMGKSTLMNALVGERVSITSPKAQTTRHRIMGIISDERSQIIYWDTPGILTPNYMLQERMLAFVHRSISDADMLLVVTDVIESGAIPLPKSARSTSKKGNEPKTALLANEPTVLDRIRNAEVPVIVAVNKIDLLNDRPDKLELLEEIDNLWKERLPGCKIVHVSAREETNTAELLENLRESLPTHPPWFDRDTLTDRNERFFVSELIREQIFDTYHQEIPYSCEVGIKKYKDFKDRVVLEAIVYVDRESQKGILIGQKGAMIKKLTIAARESIQEYVNKQVHLKIEVKVAKDWRTDDKQLRGMGYYNA